MSVPDSTTKTGLHWRTVFFVGWIMLSVWFLWRVGQRHWADVWALHIEVNWPMIVIATLFALASLFFLGIGWVLILRRLAPQAKIPMTEGLSVQSISQVGKYIPSGVAPLVMKFAMVRRWQVGPETAGASMVLETLYGLLALGLLSLGVGGSSTFGSLLKILVMVIVVAALLLLRPEPWIIIGRLANRLHRRLNIFIPPILPVRTHLFLIAWYLGQVLLMGAGFVFLIKAIFPIMAIPVWTTIQVFSAGLLVGFVTITAPAGIGVREAIIVILLQPFMSTPAALTIAVVSRLWSMSGDAIFFIIGLVIRLRYHLKLPPTV